MSEFGTLTLRDPAGRLEATFLTKLGMVVSSVRHDGAELLAQRGGPEAYAVNGSTFGIPLLHPWANRLSAWEYEIQGGRVTLTEGSPLIHRDGATGLPIHGLLAASRHWQVVDHDHESVHAEFDFGAQPELLSAFPFPHRLTYRATLGDNALTVRLTVSATGDRPVPISFGFHPYFTLPVSARPDWKVELPVRRQVVLSGGVPSGDHVNFSPGELDGPLAERAFDDCFDQLYGEPAVFAVEDGRRRVEVAFLDGYPVAQVFAPPEFGLVCFEPMTAPVDALRSGTGLRFVPVGGDFTASFSLSVR
jgi:galactose mutarotase-like enzyme